MSRWLISGLILATATWLYPSHSDAEAQRMPIRPGLITARLDSNKSVYHVGEPIMLRLTLINKMAEEIDVVADAPYDMSDLEVFDAKGKALTPTVARGPCWFEGPILTTQLLRGKPLIVEYNDPAASSVPSRGAGRLVPKPRA